MWFIFALLSAVFAALVSIWAHALGGLVQLMPGV